MTAASLDWNDIHYFVTLVEGETLSAAAQTLDVQHSTVARRVTQLEASWPKMWCCCSIWRTRSGRPWRR